MRKKRTDFAKKRYVFSHLRCAGALLDVSEPNFQKKKNPENIKSGLNRVPVTRHGPILRESVATVPNMAVVALDAPKRLKIRVF